MSELQTQINRLRRPRLLLSAVRHGLEEYNRDTILRRLFGAVVPAAPRRLVAALFQREEMLEEARRACDGTYSAARHIEVLVALISEARQLSAEAARAGRESAPGPTLLDGLDVPSGVRLVGRAVS